MKSTFKKSFKQFLFEALNSQEVYEMIENFKTRVINTHKELFPNVRFKFNDTRHIIDQVVARSDVQPNKPQEADNKFITPEELHHMLDTIYDRMFRAKDNNGLATQTSQTPVVDGAPLKITPTGEWEIQHRLNWKDHYRGAVYTLKPNTIESKNAKGKPYKKVEGFNAFTFITVLPSGRLGKDNPKYAFTNAITEAIDWDNINELVD